MGICSVRHSGLFLHTDFSCNIPSVLVNDGFVCVGEYHQLVRRCGSALLCLEVFADRFAQHGMTEIFLPVKDIANCGCVPSVGVCHTFVSAILRIVQGGIRCRYQHLLRCQNVRNGCGTVALASQTKDFPDNLCGWLVHDKGLLIVRLPLVAIRNRAAAPHSVFHSGFEYRLDFVARVLGIPLVHDIQKRSEVIVLRSGTVHIVVNGYEANALFRKENFCVIADLQIITTKAAEILYHKGFNSSGFDFFKQGGKTGTVEIRTRIAVVIKVPDISQPFLSGIFF